MHQEYIFLLLKKKQRRLVCDAGRGECEMKIGEVTMKCPACGWIGLLMDCEPDIGGEGGLGCPRCGKVVKQVYGQGFKAN